MRTLLAVGALALLVAAPSSSEVLNLFGFQPAQAANSANVATVATPTVSADVVVAKLPAAASKPGSTLPPVQVAALDPKSAAQPAPSGEPASDVRFVTASALNLRNGPSTGSNVIGKLGRDAKVTVTRQADGWLFVVTEGGESGWTSSKFLSKA